jgi:hypothetical protein
LRFGIKLPTFASAILQAEAVRATWILGPKAEPLLPLIAAYAKRQQGVAALNAYYCLRWIVYGSLPRHDDFAARADVGKPSGHVRDAARFPMSSSARDLNSWPALIAFTGVMAQSQWTLPDDGTICTKALHLQNEAGPQHAWSDGKIPVVTVQLSRIAFFFLCVGSFSVQALFGRTFSGEECLFQLENAFHRTPPVIRFSLLPLSGILSFPRDSHALLSTGADAPPVQEDPVHEFSLTRIQPPTSKVQEQPMEGWTIFETLRHWGIEAENGLCHTFAERRLCLAVEYSDIFETKCDPDKGGHGMSVFFRYSFRKE